VALRHWKTLSTKAVYENPWWSYRLNRFLIPGVREGDYHYVHTGGSVMVIPLLADGRAVMVRQYRYLDDRESLEFPSGGMRDGEDPAAIARKELIEEACMDGTLEYLGHHNPCKGIVDEKAHVFIARDLVHSDAHHKDATEEFELEVLSVRAIEEKIAGGEIYDGMSLACFAIARSKNLI
jgi:8-oxo-dGTP pyrophosphatase MutT (NUDIX family)